MKKLSFLVESMGTEASKTLYETLDKALEAISERLYAPETTGVDADRTPDSETDRILVWQTPLNGPKKLVWHFSGWMYPDDASDLIPGGMPQGRLPGQVSTLFETLSEVQL